MAMMISTTSKKPLSFLQLVAFITTFLVLLHEVNSIETISFDISRFDKESARNLVLDGDATISNNVLQLTKVDSEGKPVGYSAGRVTYSKPFHLWDKSTGVEASFTTSFKFRITSPRSKPGEGLTFFIASLDYPLGTSGGNLGLFGKASPHDKVVAVEFDTFINTDIQDPNYRHIGIDVNSKRSKITERWGWINKEGYDVTISYNPDTTLLKVDVTGFDGSKTRLTYYIDLVTELPERVKIGFTGSTGSTGEATETNELIDWIFASELGSRKNVAEEGGYIASVV